MYEPQPYFLTKETRLPPLLLPPSRLQHRRQPGPHLAAQVGDVRLELSDLAPEGHDVAAVVDAWGGEAGRTTPGGGGEGRDGDNSLGRRPPGAGQEGVAPVGGREGPAANGVVEGCSGGGGREQRRRRCEVGGAHGHGHGRDAAAVAAAAAPVRGGGGHDDDLDLEGLIRLTVRLEVADGHPLLPAVLVPDLVHGPQQLTGPAGIVVAEVRRELFVAA
mmetsp:Transcript_5019/g.9607  ORF Transcript_5019/g.9607 Transcript_5019/m.9607 type:complete len:218 (+) Transcript_5019:63-716(+)